MSLRSSARRRGRPSEHQRYRRRFLSDIHYLLGRGFQAISHEELATKEEPAITGLLTQAIEDLLDDPLSPDWTDRYTIQDERHVHASAREGKHRLRVDFELTTTRYRPRPCFQIEAKRLREPKKQSLTAYLGADGLLSFVTGRYASNEPWAGMMGYVQADTATAWVDRVRGTLGDRPVDYSVAPQRELLCPEPLDPLLQDVYRSDHLRADSSPIEIHHIFLQCC